MRSSRCFSFAPIATVALAMACQGNPPVHNGDGLLEFGTSFQDQAGGSPILTTRLSLYDAAPFEHWGYHLSALVGETAGTQVPGDFDLVAFPLHVGNDGTSEPFMQYHSTVPFWTHSDEPFLDIHDQHEIDLFARDPAEQAATLRALSIVATCNGGVCGLTNTSCSSDNDCGDINIAGANWLAEWEQQWAPGRSPLVPRMMYPPQSDTGYDSNAGQITNSVNTVAGIVTSDFWTGPPRAPGAAPDGSGSVKAVEVMHHGVCGAFQPYFVGDGSGLLETLMTQFPKFVLAAVAQSNNQTNGTCDTLEQQFLVTAPYLDFWTDQEQAQHGGFLFGTQLNIEDAVTGGGPNFLLYFQAEWRLFDGRLTTQGEVLDLPGQGTGFSGVQSGFPPPLTREMDAPLAPGASGSTVAEAIWSIAYSKQRFNGIPVFQPPFTSCTARPDGRVIAAKGVSGAPCEDWRTMIDNNVQTAIGDVGASVLGLNADEQAEVLNNNFEAIEVVNGDTVWKNIRCADLGDKTPSGDSIGPVCYYELPARRLNAYPDGVELIFLDQLQEIQNPVYPIWLMLLEFETQGLTTTLSPLCDDAFAQDRGSLNPPRSLQALPSMFHATYNCTGPASDCGSSGNNCCCDQVTVSP